MGSRIPSKRLKFSCDIHKPMLQSAHNWLRAALYWLTADNCNLLGNQSHFLLIRDSGRQKIFLFQLILIPNMQACMYKLWMQVVFSDKNELQYLVWHKYLEKLHNKSWEMYQQVKLNSDIFESIFFLFQTF